MFSRLPLNSTMADGTTSYGRGVWESNPPGTAPSDPPAVLKTVRPTGTSTPPLAILPSSAQSVKFGLTDAARRSVRLSSVSQSLVELLDTLDIDFSEIFDDQLGF